MSTIAGSKKAVMCHDKKYSVLKLRLQNTSIHVLWALFNFWIFKSLQLFSEMRTKILELCPKF